MHNLDFNIEGFQEIASKTGLNSVVVTPKEWIASTNAIGVYSKTGRTVGTFAYKDIAFDGSVLFLNFTSSKSFNVLKQ